MSAARKVLEWRGQADPELTRELAELPPGRYVLIPEDELDDLSADDESAIEEGRGEIERGDTVPWEQVRADLEVAIAASRTGRTR